MRPDQLASTRLPNVSVRIMAAMLRSEGIDLAPVLAAAGISEQAVDDPLGQISALQEMAFQEAFCAATAQIEGLWLRTGFEYRTLAYGALGQLVTTATTVREALELAVHYQALTFSLSDYCVEDDEDEGFVLASDIELQSGQLMRFTAERDLSAATIFIRDLDPSRPLLRRVESQLPYPANWMDCEAMLGVPVAFGAPRNRWLFEPGAAESKLPMSSPLLEQTYQRQCESLVGSDKPKDELLGRLVDLLVRSEAGYPASADAARQLGLSERSLHRRLKAAGTSFGGMLDKVREQRARSLLNSTRLPVARISDMLHFSECASFTRAFKRWTGTSPLKFRQQSLE